MKLPLPIPRSPSQLLPKKLLKLQIRHNSSFDIYTNTPIPPNKQRFVPTSGTYPKGFLIGSIHAGIKPAAKCQPDLVLVASEIPSNSAAVFTKNAFPAPSITVSREIMRKMQGSPGTRARGVIVNSWCANLFTGKEGMEDTWKMSMEASKYVSGSEIENKNEDENAKVGSSVMVMHTGIGGTRLPLENIIKSLPSLHTNMRNSHDHWLQAATGITTTDTFPKLLSRTFTLPSSPNITYSLAGITKGAGMIHPNMATTLGILCTDIPISPLALQHLFTTAVEKSYNSISCDGHTSTNDMLCIFANGAAGGQELVYEPELIPSVQNLSNHDYHAFQKILNGFMTDMAKLVVRDGEGATKFITIRVRNAPTYEVGKLVAEKIATSSLFKTSIFGKDANWGGAFVAVGNSLLGSRFEGKYLGEREKVSVSFVDRNGREVRFLDNGVEVKVAEEVEREVMEEEDVEIVVDLGVVKDGGEGVEEVVYWTCDLTHEFVSINSDFRT